MIAMQERMMRGGNSAVEEGSFLHTMMLWHGWGIWLYVFPPFAKSAKDGAPARLWRFEEKADSSASLRNDNGEMLRNDNGKGSAE